MREPIYIWEITVPVKIEYKFWQACFLLGFRMENDCLDVSMVPVVSFSDYTILHKNTVPGFYADILVTCTDDDMRILRRKLDELGCYDTEGWILDEIDEEE